MNTTTFPIHREQYKNIPAGEVFYWIKESGELQQHSFTNSNEVWTCDTTPYIGIVRRCPNGQYLATIRADFPILGARTYCHWNKDFNAAGAKAFDKMKVFYDKEEQLKADPVKELAYLKEVHDPYFNMSDDHSVWAAGEARIKRMNELTTLLS